MRFAPKPENDFAHYIATYYNECRARFDRIEAIAGKWMFRDLIPGMSDFDTRFICDDEMTVDDWCRMSTAVGEAHLSLCRRFPSWARNLEHLPGINLTWHELLAERSYYPEYRQWSFYRAADPKRLGDALAQLEARPWDIKDDYFHLKKFCLYYGRYDREIDPAVNLGVHENKYPLHSRLMHYFTPPVQSAMCLLDRHHYVGKFEALERASVLFPGLPCWDMAWEILGGNYETPAWYEEPRLSELEDALEEALAVMAEALRETASLIPPETGVDIAAWKNALATAPVDPAMVIFDSAKFSRLMKGRLEFYATAPAHFDHCWVIQNELRRLGRNFFEIPFRAFWKLRSGEEPDDPKAIVEGLRGEFLDNDEADAALAFHRLTPGHWEAGREREIAIEIVAVFDEFFAALNKVSQTVLAEPAPGRDAQ